MSSAGRLFIVATPIGNLDDMTPRAIHTLKTVDSIAAEDTRHSGKLLKHFAIDTPMLAYHDHNEEQRSEQILGMLAAGKNIALVSDAGTPLISDPGYRLVSACHRDGISVTPIVGASAMVAAMSVSGLPSDHFYFAGFLPAKSGPRRAQMQALATRRETLVLYESCHRITETLADLQEVFGAERRLAYCRELTKAFETIRTDTVATIAAWVESDSDQRRGEIVLLVEGDTSDRAELDETTQRWLRALAGEMAPTRAAALAAKVTGLRKKVLYDWLSDNGRVLAPSDEKQ